MLQSISHELAVLARSLSNALLKTFSMCYEYHAGPQGGIRIVVEAQGQALANKVSSGVQRQATHRTTRKTQ